MPRYLIQVEPDKREEVKAKLPVEATVVGQVLDYIVVQMPEELVPKIREIEFVVAVIPEKEHRIMVIPVDKKFERWFALFSNPLTLPMAATFSFQADVGKKHWPTLESRKLLEADIAEEEGITGKGVKVAVADTGWDRFCLQKLGMIYATSSVEGQPLPEDLNGHGVHVATTVAGNPLPTPWGMVKGVAPDVELGIFKVLGYGVGVGSTTSILRGLIDAFEWGAEMINMSLGSSVKPDERVNLEVDPEVRVVQMLSRQGIIFAIAAGNDGKGYASVPGVSPDAITVGAINMVGEVADFSSRSHTQYIELRKPEVVAPGVDILSSTVALTDLMQWMDGPKMASISGTSMATPHVMGVIALWKQYARERGYNLTPEMVKSIIREYGATWSEDYGYGLPKYSWIKDYLKR